MPEVVDIIIEFIRDRPNKPMEFRISVKACFEEATGSTTSTSSVYTQGTGSTSSSVYVTSSGPGLSYTGSRSASVSGPSVTYTSLGSQSGSISSGPSATGSVSTSATTVCTVEEGMDEPQYIPNENIKDPNDRVPNNVNGLRPGNKNPFTVNRPTYTVRLLFQPAIPAESLKLIRPTNVDTLSVWYISPRRPNSRIEVVDVSVFAFCVFI